MNLVQCSGVMLQDWLYIIFRVGQIKIYFCSFTNHFLTSSAQKVQDKKNGYNVQGKTILENYAF